MSDFRSLCQTISGWSSPDPSGDFLIGVLKGEGIGPEIIEPTLRVLDAALAEKSIRIRTCFGGSIGKIALRETGCILTDEVKEFCWNVFRQNGAVLCGPAGGRFVYELRSHFDLFCKIIPIRPLSKAADFGVLKPAAVQDVDIVVVRENVGGIYMGRWGEERHEDQTVASHAFEYRSNQVERILQVAFGLAQARRGKLTLVVKTEGMPTISRLWVQTFEEIASKSGVRTEVLEADNAAFQLVNAARDFDVVVTSNLLGDILGDLGALLLGSRGMSFSGNFGPGCRAVYQTAHGAAYNLAGIDAANPVGQICALVMLLRINFGLYDLADGIETAVRQTLDAGWRTTDIASPGCMRVGTRELAERIADAVRTLSLEAVS
jgi:3-isopropylmalate dehydrogenase